MDNKEERKYYLVKNVNNEYNLVIDDENVTSDDIANLINLINEVRGQILNISDISVVKSSDINLDEVVVVENGYVPYSKPGLKPVTESNVEPSLEPIREPISTEFMNVDIKEYVSEGLNSGKLTPIYAKKTAPTRLVQGEQGEKVVSWVENEDGTPRIEREGTVQIDDETGELGWIATKVDMNGDAVIDRNGHMNQWIIKDSVVRRTYEPSKAGENLYQKKEVQTLVQIPDNIVFENKYGEVMNVAAGGYINITNYERMYGISERDFNDTHKLINEIGDDEKSAYEQAKQQFEELRLKLLKDAEQNGVEGFGRTR